MQVKRLFCDLTLDQIPNAGPTLIRINVKKGQNFAKQGRNFPRQVRWNSLVFTTSETGIQLF